MKKFRYILTMLILLAGVSCDQNEFLVEKPKDFLTPENSFTSKKSFESALGDIYLGNRNKFYSERDNWDVYDLMGMDLDLAWVNEGAPDVYTEMFNWNTFNADAGFASKWWAFFYRQIFKANTIVDRSESDVVTWNSEEEKNAIVAEARFLRAYYYRFLANMWGGVPLVLEETSGPKFDYTRATLEEVYQQCKDDLTFAIQWMPTVDEVPGGRAPRAAAYHILAEVNIQLKDYQGAIDAASSVINGSFSLNTERFGRYKDFEWRGYDFTGPAEPWGDVFWDMFREGNFNRIDGNTETIWNVQFEYGVVGGFVPTNRGEGLFNMERWWGGGLYWHSSFQKDINGVSNVLKDTLMGRVVGFGGATDYMENQVWNFKGDFNNDMRNSKYNVQRTWYWNNPAGAFFGTPVTAATIFSPDLMETGRAITPSFKKCVTLAHHGNGTQDGEFHDQGAIYKDWYIIRLAETYLLRAEAYHLKGDNANAANDLNTLRNRAQATPVTGGEVDIDLILDERARELYMEEYRINTLLRMGKLVEYLQKYNSVVLQNGYVLGTHLNLMPIPNSEIEANKEVELVQNPGY